MDKIVFVQKTEKTPLREEGDITIIKNWLRFGHFEMECNLFVCKLFHLYHENDCIYSGLPVATETD